MNIRCVLGMRDVRPIKILLCCLLSIHLPWHNNSQHGEGSEKQLFPGSVTTLLPIYHTGSSIIFLFTTHKAKRLKRNLLPSPTQCIRKYAPTKKTPLKDIIIQAETNLLRIWQTHPQLHHDRTSWESWKIQKQMHVTMVAKLLKKSR